MGMVAFSTHWIQEEAVEIWWHNIGVIFPECMFQAMGNKQIEKKWNENCFNKFQHSVSYITVAITDRIDSQIAKFMGPTWGPPGSCRSQMGPILTHEPCVREAYEFE